MNNAAQAYDVAVSFFANTPLFNGVSFIFGLIGIILAFIFYYRGQKSRLPLFLIVNFNLIKEKVENVNGLKVSFQKKSINNLSVAKIALWNGGNETIRRDDNTNKDPLRLVSLRGYELLDVKVIYQKNLANNFSVALETSNKALINYDYFDKSEGVILQVFHTGKTSHAIEIQGTVKGYGAIKRMNEPFMFQISQPINGFIDKYLNKYKKIILGIMLIVTPMISFISMFTPKATVKNSTTELGVNIIFTLLYWGLAYSILRRRVPKGFDLFEEDTKTIIR